MFDNRNDGATAKPSIWLIFHRRGDGSSNRKSYKVYRRNEN